MKVSLNNAEQKLAVYLGRSRFQNARSRGIPNMKMGPQSNEQTDIEGAAAEIAYCKLMNIYPDTEITAVLPNEDAIARCGWGIDVKSTRYPFGRLLAVCSKAGKAPDCYALMIGTFPEYRFAGHMTSAELLKSERLTNLGHGEGYAAHQKELDKP